MSTFFHSDNSPLLGNQINYDPTNPADPYSVYRQQLMNQYMAQMQNNGPTRDFLDELDTLVKGLNKDELARLEGDVRYNELNGEVQAAVQHEIMSIVKGRINASLGESIKEEIDIIKKIKNDVKNEERENYYQMQDYLKNYSHLTFDDYKNLKNKPKVETDESR